MLDSGNQQATTGWIAGILDGEGSFRTHNKIKSPEVRISNTNKDLIEACESFFRRNYILYTTYKGIRKGKAKDDYNITIYGDDARNLYKLLEPQLQCRRKAFQEIVGASETERDVTASLDYLIGIWQAEGSFYITESFKQYLKPKLVIVNINQKIIQRVILSLKELGCSWYVKDYVPEVNTPYTVVSMEGIKRCQRFLTKTQGLWIGKRDQRRSSLMLEYINSRLSNHQREPYSEKQMQIYYEMRELSKRGK